MAIRVVFLEAGNAYHRFRPDRLMTGIIYATLGKFLSTTNCYKSVNRILRIQYSIQSS